MSTDEPLVPAKNPRGWRWQREVQPGRWRVQCRGCPRRYSPRKLFDSSTGATAWWHEHQQTEAHQRHISVSGLQKYRNKDAGLRAIFGTKKPGPTVRDAARLPPEE